MTKIVASELWIGDILRSTKTGKIGKFEGIHSSGKLRLNIGNKTILVSSNNLEYYNPEVTEELLFEEGDKDLNVLTFDESQKEIDLHIEILKPSLANALPERIADIQIKTLNQFIGFCKQKRIKEYLIIHGIGKGVLRDSVHQILSSDKDVRSFVIENNGGATRVFMY